MPDQEAVEFGRVAKELIDRLAGGWEPKSPIAEEFVRLWRKALNVDATLVSVLTDAAYFTTSLDAVRLTGFSDVHVLLIGGSLMDLSGLHELKTLIAGPGRQLFVLSCGEQAYSCAKVLFPSSQGYLLLADQEVHAVLGNTEPQYKLALFTRDRLPLLRLNPFGILRCPDDNMFFGRQSELDILMHSEMTSYAVAGPGRIGKTSLVQRFKRTLMKSDPIRAGRTVMIDFLSCEDNSADGITQFLATRIHDGSRARYLKPGLLEKFLAFEREFRGGPLELILDEVDGVCRSKPFAFLAEAARHGLCRLILCGKGVLYDTMHEQDNVLCARLRLLRLSPLGEEDATNLLCEPLRALGFEIADEEHLVAEVLQDTARMPHLIQFYGGALVEAAANKASSINPDLLELIRHDFETAQTFAFPLAHLQSEIHELIALSLLHQHQTSFTEHEVWQIARREGLPLSEQAAAHICRDLYINNVLMWDRDHYQIANRAISRYARRLGYFAPRLAELRKRHGKIPSTMGLSR